VKIKEPGDEQSRELDDEDAGRQIQETEAWLKEAKRQGHAVVWDPSKLATWVKPDDAVDEVVK
jgi:hypothetical protein